MATALPVAAYQVSGEYAMLKGAAERSGPTSAEPRWKARSAFAGPAPTDHMIQLIARAPSDPSVTLSTTL